METPVTLVDLDAKTTQMTQPEAWAKIKKDLNGKEIVVKTTEVLTKDNEFPNQFSIRGVLQVGIVQARIVINHDQNDDCFVYFGPHQVESIVEGRLSDQLPGLHLKF
jgi:hypothetical protein